MLENGWLSAWLRPTGWLTAICLGFTGDRGLDVGALPSPSRTRVSMVRSRLPFSPFNIVKFRFSSANPISRSLASLDSMFSPPPPTLAPNTLDCLFTRIGGDGGYAFAVSGEVGGDTCERLVIGRAEETDRRPKPKRFPGLGGRGGG